MWLKVFVTVLCFNFAISDIDPRKLYASKSSEDLVTSLTDPFDNLNYRLPNNTRPTRYNLWLTTDIHRGAHDFLGRVKIQIEALENSDQITLHYRQITITNIDFFNSAGALIESDVPFSHREDVEFLIIKPTESLVKGRIYSVEISYEGTLRDDNMGFYQSSYVDKDGKRIPLASTKFEPHNARHAFPW